jgi:hypothetical protein
MATIYLLAKTGELQNPTFASKLEGNLEKHFSHKWRNIGAGAYLVSVDEPTVTQDLAEKLEVTGGGVGSYIVTKLDPYYGWGSKAMWEWISTHDD